MYHFFVEPCQIGEKEIRIEGSDVNHIRNVLRMGIGEQITVSSGEDKKEFRCEIAGIEESCIRAKIMWIEEKDAELPSKIYLFQGLPKGDKMEWIIQKAVELGACEIIPMATKRAVVKLDPKKAAAKVKRWNAISESAAKQSKRLVIPQVHEVMSFREAVSDASGCDKKLIPYELAEGMDQTRNTFSQITPGDSVAVFIGPEGGFDEEEITLAQENGILPITLGRRILRTETAGMAVLSVLMFQLEQK